MPRYTVTEPHPTVLKDAYTHSGRGGAGNMFRAPQTTAPTGVPSTHRTAPKQSSTRFYSGRGGAGNAHTASERTTISFDEEYASAAAREQAHYGHVGRGGAGNVFMGSTVKDSASSRRDSSSTNGSQRSGFWSRLSHSH